MEKARTLGTELTAVNTSQKKFRAIQPSQRETRNENDVVDNTHIITAKSKRFMLQCLTMWLSDIGLEKIEKAVPGVIIPNYGRKGTLRCGPCRKAR